MTIKRSSSVVRSVEVDAEYQVIESSFHKNLLAYRATYTEAVPSKRNGRETPKEPTVKSFKGICWKKELDAFLSGKTLEIPSNAAYKRRKYNSWIRAAKPRYLSVARKSGYNTGGYYKEEEDPYLNIFVDDPLTALENNVDLIFIEDHNYNHTSFDINGKQIPTALRFDYIEGCFDNENYNLFSVVKHLMKRRDITLHPNGNEHSFYYEVDDEDPKYYIGRIPHYNSRSNRDRCIGFTWHPTDKDHEKLCARYEEEIKTKEYCSLRDLCISMDIFGVKKYKHRVTGEY